MNGDHDGRITALELKVNAMHVLMLANTEITTATKADTEALITLYKGGALFGKIFLWLVLAGAAIASILTWFKGRA